MRHRSMTRVRVRRLFRILFWIALLVAYTAAIIPGDPHIVMLGPRIETIVPVDKSDHLITFATLAVLGRLGWSRGRWIWVALGLIGFGALMELTQAIPQLHRDATMGDWLTDIVAVLLGCAAGTLLLFVIRRVLPD